MYTQNGGVLPVFIGSRHQRGGGILSSVARFLMPVAKKMLTETVKAAPSVVDNILNKRQNAGAAILGGLKNAGKNTALDTLNRAGFSSRKNKRVAVKRLPNKKMKRRKNVKKDIFS